MIKTLRMTLLSSKFLVGATSLALFTACGDKTETKTENTLEKGPAFASTYTPLPSETTLITNARIIDGTGKEIQSGSILITDGKITSIGTDVTGDVHAHGDGNEVTSPITSEVYAEHGVWPQDPGFDEALQGGVTTLHVLPGSANLFGGRGVTLRNTPVRTVQEMKFPDAPYTLKMACGENPKRVYGNKGGPGSRMGNVAGYRKNWIKAQDYKKKRDKGGDDFKRDLQLETLADVLDGKILVQMHCYRADEMVQILDIAKEFDYKVTTFHHAVESYKIADILKEHDTCSAMWADWYGFKMESYDGILENVTPQPRSREDLGPW